MVDNFAPEPHELAPLREAVRQVDVLDELHAVAQRDGVVITGPDGQPRTHPAVVEARQARLALARVVSALRLPDEENVRPQRRSGVRAPYKLRSA